MKRLAWLLIALSLNALAAPAPWYWWVSEYDGKRFCSQTSPGEGWHRLDRPYRNSRCERG
jgi:hypothetical protein